MKTNRSIIPISIFLSLVLAFSSGFTFGQGRSNRGRSDNTNSSREIRPARYENTSGRERTASSNSRNDRSSYNYSRDGNSGSSNSYEYTPSVNHQNAEKKIYHNYANNNPNNIYVKEHHYYHHAGTYSYHRPMTYHTWYYPAPWEYAHHAIVFRHDHGDYFFHHGKFYRYHPVRGYYRVDHPSTIVFNYLPVGFEEVFIGGGLYYRYGEVFFEYSPWGYRIVPRPAGIIVTARF